jgi:hypothetical protein
MSWRAYIDAFMALPQPARGFAGGIAGILGLILVVIVVQIFVLGWEGWQEINTLSPRIARLKGYEVAKEEIVEARAMKSLAMEQIVFVSAVGDDRVGAQLQQTLRGFAEESGLTVIGSQLVAGEPDESVPPGFEVLRVHLNMVGYPQSLSEFLNEVYRSSPYLQVLKLNMGSATKRQSRRRSNQAPSEQDDQNLTLDVHIMALMVTA